MAKALSCSQQVYSNYELGQRDIPTDILIKLSLFYNVSTDYILGITNNPRINKQVEQCVGAQLNLFFFKKGLLS